MAIQKCILANRASQHALLLTSADGSYPDDGVYLQMKKDINPNDWLALHPLWKCIALFTDPDTGHWAALCIKINIPIQDIDLVTLLNLGVNHSSLKSVPSLDPGTPLFLRPGDSIYFDEDDDVFVLTIQTGNFLKMPQWQFLTLNQLQGFHVKY